MSDFLLSAGIDLEVQDVEHQLRWMTDTHIWSGLSEGLTWVATQVGDADLWAPAWHQASGTRAIVLGRFAFDESEWKEAESLPYEGGLAARLILARWLKSGATTIEKLNGAGVAIIINEASRELHLWTDRLGFYPAFAWTGSGFVVCSHPDVMAHALEQGGHPCAFDAVTMAEFLRTGTATQPHTYWRGIDQLNAGTHYRFAYDDQPRLKESNQYWRPAYLDRPYLEDRREIVTRLVDALTSAVRKRTLPRLGNVALLLSAGADSRTALFAACEPSNVTCFTFYDEPNAEFRSSQKLAEAAGATHIGYQRSKDHYVEHANESVRLSAGMWSIDSAHYGGIIPQLHSTNAGVVLTGCYADYLLKGLAYNRTPKKLLGRAIPLYQLSDFSHEWYQPFSSLQRPWHDRVLRRLEQRFASVSSGGDNAPSIAEYLRLAPIIREADASGRLILRRTCPHDFFMADNEVLELCGVISPQQKLSGIPFGMAVDKITGSLGREVLNNNYSAPVGATEIERVSAFVLASLRRKLTGQGSGQPFERDPTSIATVGSWPHYPRVIKMSERLRDWRSALPKDHEDFIFDLLGEERRRWSLDNWAERDCSLFFRVFTASLWLSQHPEALASVASTK